EAIHRMNPEDPRRYWTISKNVAAFIVVVSLILLFIFSFFHNQLRQIEKEYGAHGTKQENQKDKESLTKQDKDGSISNKKEMGLSGGRKSSKRLVFIAKLDNYFPGTEVPNPLYFTYD